MVKETLNFSLPADPWKPGLLLRPAKFMVFNMTLNLTGNCRSLVCICIAADVSLTFRGKLNYRWKELGNRKHLLEESGFKKLHLINKSQLQNDLKLFVVLVRSLPPSPCLLQELARE